MISQASHFALLLTGIFARRGNLKFQMMHDPFRLGPWAVDPAGRELTDGTVRLTLSPRAMGVLVELCRAGTRTVGRSELLDLVWPDVTVSDESLTQAVAELRRAFRSRAGDAEIVATVPKAGYRLRVEAEPGGDRATKAALDSPTISMEAYCLVLQANAAMISAHEDALVEAVELSREAVEMSPGSAMANAACSIMLTYTALYGGGGRRELQTALEYADAAISVGPKSSISHAAKGFSLGALGRFDEASSSHTRSVLLDDRHDEAHYLAARTSLAAGNHRSAFTLALRTADLVSDPSRPLFLAARAAFHFDPELSKRIAHRCVRELRRRLAGDPEDPRSLFTLGPALGLAGEVDMATDVMVSTMDGRTPCLIHHTFGFSAVRDDRRALDQLERAIDEGYRDARWLIREPALSGLRDTPRFQRMTRMLEAA